MEVNILIADSGSTKTEWCLLDGKEPKIFHSEGMSPYFADTKQLRRVLNTQVLPQIEDITVGKVYFYGTGCKSDANKKEMIGLLQNAFASSSINLENDLFGAALGLCGRAPGIACILGTGSNSCYFDGYQVVQNSPGLGYVLGDEGSGAVLGKKVIQHYLYDIFEEDMRALFDAKFVTNGQEILDRVYKQPLPNRYLASFAIFLAENRGHYMIENIIEDGLNEFFYTHIIRYSQAERLPIHFTGGIAFGFKDVITELCTAYGLQLGNIYKSPMEGLIALHRREL